MKLGDRVAVTAIFKRKSVRCDGRWAYNRFWEAEALTSKEGVYIGLRTLSNGVVFHYDDDAPDYTDVKYVRAAVVVFSEYTNPVYVPFDAITPL